MKYISLPESQTRRLSFYLAMEEYVARNVKESDCFFMWQVDPSVIFGRNQLIENEVNLEYCKQHGIQTFRRKSGGGCVYADMSNIMFAYITDDENVNFTFNRYINMVLRKLGVDARGGGRNDIMIGDRKVSGNAFYHIPGRSIVHGTMLYDTNMENMVGSITPTNEKLVSKGIASVRQRIALLKDYISMDIEAFKRFVRENLCEGEIMLSQQDIARIEEMEKEYLTAEFIYGKNPRYSVVHAKRIEGVGDLELRLELKNNVIKSANLMGDFFLVGDVDNRLLALLKDVPLEREAVSNALPPKVDDLILNLDRQSLVDLIMGD